MVRSLADRTFQPSGEHAAGLQHAPELAEAVEVQHVLALHRRRVRAADLRRRLRVEAVGAGQAPKE